MSGKMEWTQDGKLNVFDSGDYHVEMQEDDSWMVTFKGGSVGTAPSKTKAMNLATKHRDQPAAPEITPDLHLTASEHALLGALPSSYGDLVSSGIGGLNPSQTVSKLQSLGRRKLVVLGDNVEETALGATARAEYKPVDPRYKKDGTPRKSGAETKYGPRPEWAGERVTQVEWLEGRLANAEASLAFSNLRRRVHPYSKRVEKRYHSSYHRVVSIRELLAEARVEAEKALAEGREVALADGEEGGSTE
jgi:hypothetical protein